MRGSGVAAERSLWRGAACVAAWLLIGWVALVGPASAGIVKEATDRVASSAGADQGAVNALPPPPKAVPSPPKAVPSPPKAVPPPSKALPPPSKVVPSPSPPAPPRIPSRPTGGAPGKAPAPPHPPPSSGVDAPGDDGIAGVAGDAGRSVTSAAGEAGDRVPTGPSEGGSANAAPSDPAGAGKKTRLSAAATAKRTPLSVGPADVAAVQRWFARVWPAIALGGEDGQGLLVPTAIAAELLRPLIAVADRSLQAVASVVRAVGGDGAPAAGRPVQPHAPNGFLSNVAAAADWEKIPYLVAIAILLALLAYTMWREFRSALRPHVR